MGLAIVSLIFYFNVNHVKQVSFYKKIEFNDVSNKKNWKLFQKELKVSKENTKIENFQLILDKKNHIYSVNFDLVDKVNDKFNVYHYIYCFSCELKEEKKVSISKSTAKEWLQYNQLVAAERFFSALDELNKKDFFDESNFEYRLIVSSGWNEERLLEGDYYFLKNNSLQKISNTQPKSVSSSFNLQVIGSDRPSSFSTDIETTKFVFVVSYLEK
jgi:hypothetical protein